MRGSRAITAREGVSRLSSPEEQSAAGETLVEQYARSGKIDEIADLLNVVKEPSVRHAGLFAIASTLAKTSDFTRLDRWLEELDADSRDEARASVVALQATNLPAAEETIAQIQNPFYRSQARGSLVQRLLNLSNPNQVADWALKLPSAADRVATVNNVLTRWEAIDLDGADSWLMQLPAGAVKDSILETYIRNLKGRDAQRARKLARQIANGPARRAVERGIP